MTAMRISYVGELGRELHLDSADLETVYQAISAAGAPFGLVDFGSYALNAMRIEKGYHAWGSDFGTEYTLFDVGLEKFAATGKPDFVGRKALLEQRARRAEWTFAGFFVPQAQADPLPGDSHPPR